MNIYTVGAKNPRIAVSRRATTAPQPESAKAIPAPVLVPVQTRGEVPSSAANDARIDYYFGSVGGCSTGGAFAGA